MLTLAKHRKNLREIGFKLSMQSVSWGHACTYTHIKTGESMTFNVAPPEAYEKWEPLFQYMRDNKDEVLHLKKEIEKESGGGVYRCTGLLIDTKGRYTI